MYGTTRNSNDNDKSERQIMYQIATQHAFDAIVKPQFAIILNQSIAFRQTEL